MRLFLILCLLPFLSSAQSIDEKVPYFDSLKQVIETAEYDSTIINTLTAWARKVRRSDRSLSLKLFRRIDSLCNSQLNNPEFTLDSEDEVYYKTRLAYADRQIGGIYDTKGNYAESEKYTNTSLILNEQLGNQLEVGRCIHALGNILWRQGKQEAALEQFNLAISKYQAAGSRIDEAKALNSIGMTYENLGQFNEAIKFQKQSLKIAEDLGDKQLIGNTLNNIGNNYHHLSNYTEAIKNYTLALGIAEEMQNKLMVAYRLGNIGLVYYDQKNYEKAAEYLERALPIIEKEGAKAGLCFALFNIGNVYIALEKYEKATNYSTRALRLAEEINYPLAISIALANLADIAQKKENYEQAIDYFKQSLEIKESIGEAEGIVNTLSNIGNIHFLQKNYSDAISYGESALAKAREMGSIKLVENGTSLLYKSYKAKGDIRRALQMYEENVAANDSILNITNQAEIIRQEYKYAYEKQSLADSIQNVEWQKVNTAQLAAEKAIVAKQKQQSYFLFAGLAFALLLGGIIFNRFKTTQKQKKIIEHQKKQVDESFHKMQFEKQKGDILMLNILPKSTADELKENGIVAARFYPSATVLFTDFKSFSEITEKMTPNELVNELHYCFSAFDRITQKHNVEKIKTMGDSYMAAGGVPATNSTHAEDTLKAALEIQEFMQQYGEERTQKNEPFFQIRIGVHSGPLIAGVVGLNKFQYDIWGDTVNIASRMETHSKPGMVNISGSTYELVKHKPEYVFKSRGKIEVKGKDQKIAMHFVKRKIKERIEILSEG